MFTFDRICRSFLLMFLIATTPLRADETTFTPPEIQVPDGFVVEVAAAPPLVKHPMMAALDDRGRLFIAESAGGNSKSNCRISSA